MSASSAAYFQGDELWENSWTEDAGEKNIRQRLATENPKLSFYTSWFCPFAQRAWIALEETGVEYKWIEINPYEVDPKETGGYTKKSLTLEKKSELYPDFISASPRGLVPAIQHENKVVWESLPLVEYISKFFGDGSLIPTDPYEIAMAQIWAAHCTERIQKNYYATLMAQDEEEQKSNLKQFFQECRMFANAMSMDGPFFFGHRFSLVDVALAPFWQRMLWVGKHYRNLKFPTDEKEFVRLEEWWKATSTRPSVAATLVCKPRLIASYSQYSRNVATSDFAMNMKK